MTLAIRFFKNKFAIFKTVVPYTGRCWFPSKGGQVVSMTN